MNGGAGGATTGPNGSIGIFSYSGAAGGGCSTGTDAAGSQGGGVYLFQGGTPNPTLGQSGGGASAFANGGNGITTNYTAGSLGSGGSGAGVGTTINGGTGFVTITYYSSP